MPNVAERLTNSCQRWGHPLRSRNIIKANHTDILGNTPSPLVNCLIDTNSLGVTGCNQGSWWIGEIQKDLRLPKAAFYPEITFAHVQRNKGQTSRLQGR